MEQTAKRRISMQGPGGPLAMFSKQSDEFDIKLGENQFGKLPAHGSCSRRM